MACAMANDEVQAGEGAFLTLITPGNPFSNMKSLIIFPLLRMAVALTPENPKVVCSILREGQSLEGPITKITVRKV